MKRNKFWSDNEVKFPKEEFENLTADQKTAIKYCMKMFIAIHADKARIHMGNKNGK